MGGDSYNLLPALIAKPPKGGKPIREDIVHHSSEGMFAIRQGEWKLILGLGSGGFSEPDDSKRELGKQRGSSTICPGILRNNLACICNNRRSSPD